MADSATIALTDFHHRPGEAVDRSQRGPVTLTKRNRPFAVVVSADWFEQAQQAMAERHGHRRLLDAGRLDPADRDFILNHGPSEAEVDADQWQE